LIIDEYFSDRYLHAFVLEGRKESDMGTYDSDDEKTKCKFYDKEGHCMRDYVLFKSGLKRKVFKDFRDIDPRKDNKTIRVYFKNVFYVLLMKKVLVFNFYHHDKRCNK
jgi:hypothetical protein